MPALRRNEVVKVNREWLALTAENLDLVADCMERGETVFNLPAPTVVKNIAAALRRAALKGKEEK